MDLTHVSGSLGIVHPLCIERGRNAEVWDEQGRHYIDFIGGIGVLNLGHGHPVVVEAVKAQAETLMHSAFNALPHRGYLEVVEALDAFVPVGYPLSCMLTNSGAEATENAALNLNGKVKPYKARLGALPGPVFHLPFPSRDSGVSAGEAMAALARLFEVEVPSDEVAAIIVEPIQGEGGFRLLDADFAARLRALCDDHGILLILDEIQSGFGRTGRRFGFSHLNIEPDLLLMGKSIAAGLPLAALAGKPALMDALPKGGLGGTYSGNAVACAAARAVMGLMTEDNLRQWGEGQERRIIEAHRDWRERFPMVGALTGVGAMRGIVFDDTAHATGAEHLATLLAAGREAGVLLMPSGRRRNVLRLLAPLTTEPEVMDEGLARLTQALEALNP